MISDLALPADHPGFHDPEYRKRRSVIAEQSGSWTAGEPVPRIEYSVAEHGLWTRVLTELRERHKRLACEAFLTGACALDLPADQLPQLEDLRHRLEALSNFSIEPVPGLVSPRDFYGRLADGVFLSTQYIRHTSVPFYTPEPDVVHEVSGHVNMLANPVFAELHRLAGECSRRCVSDEAHEFFSRVFWFTLEFGVVWEADGLKAYGAGLASSFGEIEEFRNADIRPFDIVAMGSTDYDITHYQPVLFAAESFDQMVADLTAFFTEFDDAMHAEMVQQSAASVEAPDLLGVDHVEWWVGNARHTAQFFASEYGFDIVAYAGPETGRADTTSYVVRQGDITFVLTSALEARHDVAEHVLRHGDGVHSIAFKVDDVPEAFRALVFRGATPSRGPSSAEDTAGVVHFATLRMYGDTEHVLIDRSAYDGVFMPGFEAADRSARPGPLVGLQSIDHIVANVEEGTLDAWVERYEQVFGFHQLVHFDADQISTEHSALRSTVMTNGSSVVLPINEPAEGRKKSQIEEYLDYYESAGVQHLALSTDDIVSTVRALRARGVRFAARPGAYYEDARRRLAGIDLAWEELEELGILVDRDEHGHLLQIFTENVASRPTLFLEIIQREGATGFGEGNFKALFEAIEAEQDRRGNL